MSQRRLSSISIIYNAKLGEIVNYPGCLVNGKNPYDEQIMSMPSIISDIESNSVITITKDTIDGHYFFFIFNFDNYYHFLYDTLPYLYLFYKLQKIHTSRIKLLVPGDLKWKKFQIETFELLGIRLSDCIPATPNSEYSNLYIPTSLTHGHLEDGSWGSNLAPEAESYFIWNVLNESIISYSYLTSYPVKIYISRRTHLHGDMSNIGTNYTTRRKCINEDDVVNLLSEYGYSEIFCENLSMIEKINIFSKATYVIGFIGGGLSNLLFSKKSTKVGCIETPDFLRINSRFKYSMGHTDITYLPITNLVSHIGKYSLYTRVKIIDTTSEWYNKIGEISNCEPQGDTVVYTISIPQTPIAGFSTDLEYHNVLIKEEQIEAIDNGLNSPFKCDIDRLKNYLNTIES